MEYLENNPIWLRDCTEGEETKKRRRKCAPQRALQPNMVDQTSSDSPNKHFICRECGRNFATKLGHNMHIKKHTTATKEKYPCELCGKILHTRGGLTSHTNVHTLGRQFMCHICGKVFTQKVNLMQHVKQHTGDKPHSCDKCGKKFAERSHLSRHYSYHSQERPFKCEICHKMYKTERCLKVHSLVHATKRPFVCTTCSKGFLSKTKLKQHVNIHTGERPFKCNYCPKTFTNYPNLLKHTRRKHKVEHRTGKKLPLDAVRILPKIEPKWETNLDLNQENKINYSNEISRSAYNTTEADGTFIPAILDDQLNFSVICDGFAGSSLPHIAQENEPPDICTEIKLEIYDYNEIAASISAMEANTDIMLTHLNNLHKPNFCDISQPEGTFLEGINNTALDGRAGPSQQEAISPAYQNGYSESNHYMTPHFHSVLPGGSTHYTSANFPTGNMQYNNTFNFIE